MACTTPCACGACWTITCAGTHPAACVLMPQVVLSKLRPGVVEAADVPANIGLSTVSHSPLSSLYHQLKDVYNPLLGGASGTSAKTAQPTAVSAQLSDLLLQVQAGLGAAVRRGEVRAYLEENEFDLHQLYGGQGRTGSGRTSGR